MPVGQAAEARIVESCRGSGAALRALAALRREAAAANAVEVLSSELLEEELKILCSGGLN